MNANQNLRRNSLADSAYEALLEQLVDGRIVPGAHFNVDGWARKMDVSTTPIREALARLEQTGLVRRTAHKGYEVTPMMNTEDVAKHTQARLVIEPALVALAFDSSGEELVKALSTALERHRVASGRLSDSSAFRDYWDADESFHRLLAMFTKNRYLIDSYNSIASQAQRYRLYAQTGLNDADEAIAEHAAILERLREKDVCGAKSAMEGHLHGVWRRAVGALESIG